MAALRLLLPAATVIPAPWNVLGLIPLALGVIINISADNAFRQAGTTVKPFEESNALLTSGVFRLSRNPMYLGFALILVGVAIMLQAITPCLVVPIFVILLDVVFIRVEEKMIAARFGRDWLEYKEQVRRWI